MTYAPTTDFLALERLTSGGVRTARMPGLDFTVAAMARAGLFALSVGQTAPTTSQPTTVWFRPSVPSWVAEGTVFLWNAVTSEYEIATPALWAALFGFSGSSFQSVATASGAVAAATTLLAIQRAAPGATALSLPTVATRAGRPLQIADWSTSVTSHGITLTPNGTELIMRRNSWQMLSTADQLAGLTLYPSSDLNGWIISP